MQHATFVPTGGAGNLRVARRVWRRRELQKIELDRNSLPAQASQRGVPKFRAHGDARLGSVLRLEDRFLGLPFFKIASGCCGAGRETRPQLASKKTAKNHGGSENSEKNEGSCQRGRRQERQDAADLARRSAASDFFNSSDPARPTSSRPIPGSHEFARR